MKLIDRWIFDEYRSDAESLALYRIFFASFLLVSNLPVGMWLKEVPQAFFNPPLSIAALFTHFPPFTVIELLNFFLGASAVSLLVGWRTPIASVSVAVCLLLLNSWCYALGKINHDILIVLFPFVLAASGWGNVFSMDARRGAKHVDHSWTVSLLAFVIGIAMFFAGVAKLEARWWDPSVLATYKHLLQNYHVLDRKTWVAARLLSLKSPLLWKALDYATLFLELGFLPAAFNRRAFRAFCALACLFHLGVWLSFDILFAVNVVAYGAVVSYSKVPVPNWLRAGFARVPSWVFPLCAVTVGVRAAAGNALWVSDWFRPPVCLLIAGACLGATYLVGHTRQSKIFPFRLYRIHDA